MALSKSMKKFLRVSPGDYDHQQKGPGSLSQKDFDEFYKQSMQQAAPLMEQDTTSGTTTTAAAGTMNVPLYPGANPSWDNNILKKLGPKEKEVLVKTGFQFNKETGKWEITMSATVEIPSPEGVFAFVDGSDGQAVDRAIEAFKKLKDKILNKLTAKVVFMELIKPREVKE